MTVAVDQLHFGHPLIRAEDWRSPLVARLIGGGTYNDGTADITESYRSPNADDVTRIVDLAWTGLSDDYKRCINTYQSSVLTEFAALAIACILLHNAGLEITEVTRRGEKVDYWIGDRDSLLEVSGTQEADLETLRESKARNQLLANPFGIGGYVCASRFADRTAALWYYAYETDQ